MYPPKMVLRWSGLALVVLAWLILRVETHWVSSPWKDWVSERMEQERFHIEDEVRKLVECLNQPWRARRNECLDKWCTQVVADWPRSIPRQLAWRLLNACADEQYMCWVPTLES